MAGHLRTHLGQEERFLRNWRVGHGRWTLTKPTKTDPITSGKMVPRVVPVVEKIDDLSVTKLLQLSVNDLCKWNDQDVKDNGGVFPITPFELLTELQAPLLLKLVRRIVEIICVS